MPLNVFISHQWHDKQVADQLKQAIEDLTGASVWIDYRNLRPGDRIQDSIDRVLKDVDVVLVLWSPHSAASDGVAEEMATAGRLGLRIIPCFISYDDDGKVEPRVAGPIADYLGIDFHHFQTGVAGLTSFLLELSQEALPAGDTDDPRMSMLHRIREAAAYLANYRNVQGVDDDRRYWVTQIVAEIERYVESTGDVAMAGRMIAAVELIRDNDPEAYGAAMARLAPLVEQDGPARRPTPQELDQSSVDWSPPEAEPDMLDQVLLAAGAGDQLAAYRSSIGAYLATAEPALNAMVAAVNAVKSPAGIQVVQYLAGYLQEGDDLIPDHHGMYGYLDDAWLILNTAFRLIESGALTVQQVPVDWNTVMQVDPIVRTLIPPHALATLEQHILNLLQIIAHEVASYTPWMTPTESGYAPVIATGGSWEDQMNAGFAELGISW